METSIQDAVTAMAPFERIIGRWRHQDAALPMEHEVTWGLDKRRVNLHSNAPDGTLISEGSWYWHPGEGAVKGMAVALNKPAVFFDYTVRSFAGEKLVMALTAYGADGEPMAFVETWTFTDTDHYTFTLENETPAGLVKVMESGFERA